MPKKSKVALVACLGVLVLIVAGCSGSAEPGSSSGSPNTVPVAPSFVGNFAAEYKEAWENSENEAVRGVLADETITDQEWSQILNSLQSCLEERGVSLTKYHDDGSYEADTRSVGGDAGNQILGDCEKSSGEAWVGYLYRSQTSNPENVPPTQLLTDCLIRNGAVPPSYTEELYLRDAPDMSFPYVDDHGFEVFEACNANFAYTQ